MPIAVAARSKAWTIFARSNTGRGFESYSRHGYLRLFCVCVVLCVGRALATG
jgi:hypothetical protein